MTRLTGTPEFDRLLERYGFPAGLSVGQLLDARQVDPGDGSWGGNRPQLALSQHDRFLDAQRSKIRAAFDRAVVGQAPAKTALLGALEPFLRSEGMTGAIATVTGGPWGKTKLATAAFEALGMNVITVDGPRFSRMDDLHRLFGAAPGFAGYDNEQPLLSPTEIARRAKEGQPIGILLDDADRMEPRALVSFLQGLVPALQYGHYEAMNGTSIDRRTLLISTSNDEAFNTKVRAFGAALGVLNEDFALRNLAEALFGDHQKRREPRPSSVESIVSRRDAAVRAKDGDLAGAYGLLVEVLQSNKKRGWAERLSHILGRVLGSAARHLPRGPIARLQGTSHFDQFVRDAVYALNRTKDYEGKAKTIEAMAQRRAASERPEILGNLELPQHLVSRGLSEERLVRMLGETPDAKVTPLDADGREQLAMHMLSKAAQELRKRGIEVTFSREVATYLANVAQVDQLGPRPMMHFIHDIAGMIRGVAHHRAGHDTLRVLLRDMPRRWTDPFQPPDPNDVVELYSQPTLKGVVSRFEQATDSKDDALTSAYSVLNQILTTQKKRGTAEGLCIDLKQVLEGEPKNPFQQVLAKVKKSEHFEQFMCDALYTLSVTKFYEAKGRRLAELWAKNS